MIQKMHTLRWLVSLLLVASFTPNAVVFDYFSAQKLQESPVTAQFIPAITVEAMGTAVIKQQAPFKSAARFCKDVIVFDPPLIDAARPPVLLSWLFDLRDAPSVTPKSFSIRAPPVPGL